MMNPIQKKIDLVTAPQKIAGLHRYNYTVKIYAPITVVGAGLFAYASRSTGAAQAIKDVIEEIARNPTPPENSRASAYRTYPMLSA